MKTQGQMIEWLHDMAEGPMSHNPEHADTCNMLTAIREELERLHKTLDDLVDAIYSRDVDRQQVICGDWTLKARRK